MVDGETTIRLKIATVEKLKRLGGMGESYNDVIIRLVKFWSEHK